MGDIFRQFCCIPAPSLTEMNCPDQTGRVFLITGGYSGIGLELSKILYTHNATIYIAGRSPDTARKSISDIKASSPNSNGRLEFLYLDLSDLSTIKPAVPTFIAQQPRLDVLVNNAGVFHPHESLTDAHGNELHIGTNCLAPYLLYKLLLPTLTKTALSSPASSVRVAWAASIAVHVDSPQPHGMSFDATGRPVDHGIGRGNYGRSKVGNVFLANELGKRAGENDSGVVHVVFNPGNLRSGLQRYWRGWEKWLSMKLFFHPPIYGAYTELWAILTPELTAERSGAYVFPWGRFGSLPKGVEDAMRGEDEGGNGVAERFVEWCGKETEGFM